MCSDQQQALAAEAQLLLELHSCITALQPRQSARDVHTVSPANLFSALRRHIPESQLEHGCQHDATEALEVQGSM